MGEDLPRGVQRHGTRFRARASRAHGRPWLGVYDTPAAAEAALRSFELRRGRRGAYNTRLHRTRIDEYIQRGFATRGYWRAIDGLVSSAARRPFVPDAYLIDHRRSLVEIVEVEVTFPLQPAKIALLAEHARELANAGVCMRLIRCDRYGHEMALLVEGLERCVHIDREAAS